MSSPRLDPLSHHTQALLEFERALTPISPDFRVRVLNRARTSLRASLVSSAGVSVWERWRLALLAGPALGFAALAFAGYGGPEAPLPPPHANTVQVTKGAAPSVAAAAVATEPEPTDASAAIEPLRKRTAPRPADGRLGSERPESRDALELRVLQRARSALAKGEYASALDTVAEHQRRFPKGQLWEESEALRIRALAGLGKSSQARQAADRFGERYPRSVLSRSIDGLRQP